MELSTIISLMYQPNDGNGPFVDAGVLSVVEVPVHRRRRRRQRRLPAPDVLPILDDFLHGRSGQGTVQGRPQSTDLQEENGIGR